MSGLALSKATILAAAKVSNFKRVEQGKSEELWESDY